MTQSKKKTSGKSGTSNKKTTQNRQQRKRKVKKMVEREQTALPRKDRTNPDKILLSR